MLDFRARLRYPHPSAAHGLRPVPADREEAGRGWQQGKDGLAVMMSRYCAQCGTPVLDAGDTFCGNCGTPLTQGAPAGIPGASGPGRPGSGASGSGSFPPVGAVGGISGTPPSQAPTIVAEPAAGPAMGSAAAAAFAYANGAGSGPSGAQMGYGGLAAPPSGFPPAAGGYPPPPSGFPPSAGFGPPAGYAPAPGGFPAYAAPSAPATGASPLTGAWAAVLAAVGAATLALFGILALLVSSHFVLWYWPWALVSGFWLASIVLPRTRTGWAFLQALGWNLLLYVGLELLFVALFRRFLTTRLVEYLRAQYPLKTFTAAQIAALQQQLFAQAFGQLIVLVAIASVLGTLLALPLVRWSRLRALPLATGFEHSVGLPLMLLAGGLLLYFGMLVALFAALGTRSSNVLALAWGYLVPLIGCVAIIWVAAWQARHEARQVARQPLAG